MRDKDFYKRLGLLLFVFIGPMLLPQILLLLGIGFWGASLDLNLIFALFIGALIFFSSIVFLFFKKYRKSASQYLVAIIITLMLFIPAIIVTGKVRSQAFYLAGLRAEKIIVAVENFQKDNNVSPKTLHDLIPKYLDRMPYGVPSLEYSVDKQYPLKWSLSADVSTGALNWDVFMYISDKDYSGFGGGIEMLGDWAYYHE